MMRVMMMYRHMGWMDSADHALFFQPIHCRYILLHG